MKTTERSDPVLNELRVVVKALESHQAESAKKRKVRDRWIIKAHRANLSLREIGEAAGISHGAVKKVIDRANALGPSEAS